MKWINLHKYDPQAYPKDIFLEVSDEVAEALLLARRRESAAQRKMYRYKAFYSLDCEDGIEKDAVGCGQLSPEEQLLKEEAEQAYQENLSQIAEALSHIPQVQARRIQKKYLRGMKVVEIAAMEGVCESAVRASIKAGLKNILRYFEKNHWEVSNEWGTWNS